MGLDKHIPIGTADAVRGALRPRPRCVLTRAWTWQGSAITEELCEGVDYFMGMRFSHANLCLLAQHHPTQATTTLGLEMFLSTLPPAGSRLSSKAVMGIL